MNNKSFTNTMSEIFGLGTDIIAIERFKEALDKHGDPFLNKLFTAREQEYCLKYKDSKSRLSR